MIRRMGGSSLPGAYDSQSRSRHGRDDWGGEQPGGDRRPRAGSMAPKRVRG